MFKWIIEARTPNYITSAENQMIGVSGRGVLAMLEWSVVYPTDLANSELTRHFEGTAAKIVNDLIWEAQYRGGLVGMTDDWTTVEDSIGNPWDDYQSIDLKVGTPLLQVINKFSEGLGVFDVEMTPNLVLRLFKNKGVDMHEEVVYRPGQAIVEHRNKSDATKVVNTVLVEGKDGKLAQATHPTSQLDCGRREGYLQATNVTDGLSEYGQRFLERVAFSDWGIQGKVVEFVDERDNRIKPFETYFIGDWITWAIPPEGVDEDGFISTLRVKGVTCEEDPETGVVHYTLELNNIIIEYDIKLSQSIARLTNYSESDPLSTPNQTTPAPINHTHDHSLLTNLTYDSHPQYYNVVRHTNDQHENVVRVRGIKTEGENALTGEVLFKAGANVSLVQDTEGKTIVINAVKDGGEIVYDTVLKSVGKETKTSDTSATFIYHEGILHIYRQIKVESVKWYIRQAGTYDLEVINPDDGSVLKSVIDKEVVGGQQEVFTFSIPFELRAGRYVFRLTRQEGVTTWSDARTGQPFYYNAFSIEAGYYNGNATMYCPPIVLDFYDSVF